MSLLLTPSCDDALARVGTHLDGLYNGELIASPIFGGRQRAADLARASSDVVGYAARRSEVFPPARRRCALSPYLRHGVPSLPHMWFAVVGGPDRHVARSEMSCEAGRRPPSRCSARCRHLEPLRAGPSRQTNADPWDIEWSVCGSAVRELERDGWLVNQARMWLASHWSCGTGRRGGRARTACSTCDGSRAPNRLGWQWAAGFDTGR